LIQELGLSDSEILYFLQSSGMPATFSTVSVIHDRVELEEIPAMSAIVPKAEVNLEY
jgi:hypothetical protein